MGGGPSNLGKGRDTMHDIDFSSNAEALIGFLLTMAIVAVVLI